MALFEAIAGSIGKAMVSKFIQGVSYQSSFDISDYMRPTTTPEKAGVGQDIGQISYLQTRQFWDSYLREYLRG
jgi:hypothetical protein